MNTTLGEPGKFFKQMDRWIRTTWRSNSTSLLSDQTPWRTQPWSVYAIYLSSFVNFALFYDAALLITLWEGWVDMDLALFRLRGSFMDREKGIIILAGILFLSKMIKPFPHFWRNPKDILVSWETFFNGANSILTMTSGFLDMSCLDIITPSSSSRLC
jgi:hypothetical protein